MKYKFIDDNGTFTVNNPHRYQLYFPLTNKTGTLLSAISPRLAGDIKRDNEHFLTPPASSEDLRGNLLCRREFFITLTSNDTAPRLVCLSEPGEDTLEAGFLYHKLTKRILPLEVEIVNFIPHNGDTEVMHVTIRNVSRKTVSITPTSFIPLYGRSEKCVRDHRHVSSLLNRVTLTPFGTRLSPTMVFDEAGHKKNTVVYSCFGYEGKKIKPQGQFPTLDMFCGTGDLLAPQAVTESLSPVTKKTPDCDGKEACAAFRFATKRLKPNAQATYTLIMGVHNSPAAAQKAFTQLDTPVKVTTRLEQTKAYWQRYLSSLQFDLGDAQRTNWTRWVQFQPTLRKLFGNSFLPHFDYGKGGRGWRDLWQDTLTLLLTEETQAKASILHNFGGVRIDGSNATVIGSDGSFISDRNSISRVWMDHGAWPYLTLRLYINKTGDTGILVKKTTYFRDHLRRRAAKIDRTFTQKDRFLRDTRKKIYRGSVLEHLLVQILVQFFNVGKHNVIALENADWNDGLDMAPDRGESVPFSFLYAHHLKDLCIFLKELQKTTKTVELSRELILLLDTLKKPVTYSRHASKRKRLNEYFNAVETPSGATAKVPLSSLIADLEKKSAHLFSWLNKHEWLSQGFFNGYYDNEGRRVEGKRNGSTRMLLATQVFALMSGGISEERALTLFTSIKKHLYDKKRGGFRLNTDFGDICLSLGRAFGFSYGDKENGAVFSHMVVMLAYALYKQGLIPQGAQALESLYVMARAPKAQIYPLLPEYFNGEGRGLYLYLTGSASWYIYTLLEQMLGIAFQGGNLCLSPKLVAEQFKKKSLSAHFSFAGKDIHVTLIKTKETKGVLTLQNVTVGAYRLSPTSGSVTIPRALLQSMPKKVTITVTVT